ncbi:sugar phosphate isomerase/epimerase family protein [Haloferula sp. A504]|uniref:sugar phosphate isomerase/epimerase family protein n=1 Tax=Haloferula sp. A504 TaxID=3373601 RepID=UPI0031C1336D|nr:sugar phosphate isomerase/epimerase [Verrucomicrobiaceae bacterium E54]
MKSHCLKICLSLLACLVAHADESHQPEFHAFRNGVPALGYKKEALLLKELGYDGISQVGEEGPELAKRVEAYRRNGLKVLSVYLTAEETPIDPDSYRALGDGGMIELTVREQITPELIESIRQTAESAEKMNVRVALYPHRGFTVATMPQAIDLADKVDHPNLGVMFNLCHFLINEDEKDLEGILERASPRLFSVSTNGADTDGEDWTTLIRPLDEGTFPQKRLLDALRKMALHQIC